MTLRGLRDAFVYYVKSLHWLVYIPIFCFWLKPDEFPNQVVITALTVFHSVFYLIEHRLHEETLMYWKKTIDFNKRLIEEKKNAKTST